MYHYVRPDDPALPHFRHLHIDDFRRQLDYLQDEYGFVGRQDFERGLKTGDPPDGVVLTFDDGVSDHYRHVFPELLRRRLWGIFYVPTQPLTTGKMLDVHRIHVLLGRHGAPAVVAAMKESLTEDMLSHAHVEEFHTGTYLGLDDAPAANYVKRLLNYFIDCRCRGRLLDWLMAGFDAENGHGYYCTRGELAEMHRAGMVLGAHGVTHTVLNKLTPEEREREVLESTAVIESITRGSRPKTFSYPGLPAPELVPLLKSIGCQFSFGIEAGDIGREEWTEQRYVLPRWDCNLLPHGACRATADRLPGT